MELCGLLFLHGMALGAWFVPLGMVLDTLGFQSIKPFAFATSATAALISPLLFGAMADRSVAPPKVLRGLALASAAVLLLVTTALRHQFPAWIVLVLIQLQSLCIAPTSSLSVSIVLSRLSDSGRQFGPIRALGTFGWMVGCWIVSALKADSSTVAFLVSAVGWLLLAGFTRLLDHATPEAGMARLSLRERLGLDALTLLKIRDHRVMFLTVTLLAIPLAAFYPYTPSHLRALNLTHTSAWMSVGQITEIIAMLTLSAVLTHWRLKWIMTLGLGLASLRYLLYASDTPAGVVGGVALHGFAFTFTLVVAQVYLSQRIDPAWRTRAQALFSLLVSGIGSLLGYLGCGLWFQGASHASGSPWPVFWAGLTLAVGAVLGYFLAAYTGRERTSSAAGDAARN